MKRTILLGTLTAALLAPFAVAHAQSNVAISVNTPEFGIRIGGPVFHPVPVYAPVPVFAPAPVFVPVRVHAPRPFHVAPRVIHTAPVIVVPPRHAARHFGPRGGVWVAPRAYQNGDRYDRYDRYDRDDRRDGRREQRRDRDRDDYRAYNRY